MLTALLIAFATPAYVPVCGTPFKEYTVGAQNTDGTIGERVSGHHVDCRAPEWLELIAKVEGHDDV